MQACGLTAAHFTKAVIALGNLFFSYGVGAPASTANLLPMQYPPELRRINPHNLPHPAGKKAVPLRSKSATRWTAFPRSIFLSPFCGNKTDRL